MNSFKLAWRNIWRNRRRTLLTAAGIAVSCAVLVFFIGLQLSSYGAAINASTRLFQAHGQVQREGYLSKPRVHDTIPGVLGVREIVEGVPGVAVAAARGVGFALVSSEDRSYGAQIVGVEPEREAKLTTLAGVVREGAFLTHGAGMEAVLGKTLAANLRVKIGDELTLMGQAADGSFAVGVLTVAGVMESGSKEIDRLFVFTQLASFQEMFGMPAAGHAVAFVGNSVEQSAELVRGVREALAKELQVRKKQQLVVHGWEALTPGLKQAIDLDMASGWLFYLSLVVIVTFSVLNTFLMSILERTKEFGMLLALGMRPGRITWLIMTECTLLLFLGIIPGMVLGGVLLLYFGVYGFYVPGSEEILRLWNIPGAIYTQLSLPALTVGPLVLLFCCLFFVFYPAWRVRLLEAVDAMRSA